MTRVTPAAVQHRLDALSQALADLPAHQPAEVADPIFGNGPGPAAPTIPAGMPPAMAAAFINLQVALDGPPCAGDQWPFVNPPAVQAAIDAQRKRAVGRPSTVQPHQIVRLVRLVKLGHSIKQAAEKVGLKSGTACRILVGNHPLARHPAVVAAGVDLPPRPTPSAPKPSRNSGKAPRRAARRANVARARNGLSNAATAAASEVPCRELEAA